MRMSIFGKILPGQHWWRSSWRCSKKNSSFNSFFPWGGLVLWNLNFLWFFYPASGPEHSLCFEAWDCSAQRDIKGRRRFREPMPPLNIPWGALPRDAKRPTFSAPHFLYTLVTQCLENPIWNCSNARSVMSLTNSCFFMPFIKNSLPLSSYSLKPIEEHFGMFS